MKSLIFLKTVASSVPAVLSVDISDTITNPYDVAKTFNSYFASIAEKKKSHKYFSDYPSNKSNSTLFLQPTDKEEIAKILSCLNSNKQAWRGGKRQARGHHLPPFIQGEWLIIDDQKNNILVSLCLAIYPLANWLQKFETKHCLLRRSYFCSYVCVCGISV